MQTSSTRASTHQHTGYRTLLSRLSDSHWIPLSPSHNAVIPPHLFHSPSFFLFALFDYLLDQSIFLERG